MEIGNKMAYRMLLVLAVSLVYSSKPVCGLFFGKTHVHVHNTLGPNKVFNLHCRSKDDDLGEHRINDLQEYSWSFQTNYFDTTLFWCNMWWTDKNGKPVRGSFAVYEAKRDEEKCYHECNYYAQADGIHLYNSTKKKMELMYSWPK